VTTYTFAQLEGLWIQAGGSPALAPLMAGVAEVESGGNPQAYNPSGASGLWQIEIPVNESYVPGGAANVFNALDNAKAAVALSGNTLAGIQSNWLAFEPAGAAEAIAKKNGGTVPATTASTTSSTSSTGSGTVTGVQGNVPGVSAPGATPSGAVSPPGSTGTGPDITGPGGLIAFAEGLPVIGSLVTALQPALHAVATVIDYSFAMFEPGQGERALFAVAALILAFFAYRVIASSGILPSFGKAASA
jgi:Transglycosylase SLT domain